MNLEKNAIEILEILCGKSGCVISDSGGKDSSVLKHIAMKCRQQYGLKFSIQNNHTTVDAPETVLFVRQEQEKYRRLGIEFNILYPKRSMWKLIVDKGIPPTRLARYCCAELKEYSGVGEKLVTGVRKSESVNRSKNQGVVTFPNPTKKLKEKTDFDSNFIQTNRGGVVLYNLDNAYSRQLVETCYRTSKVLINPLIDWDDEFLWWYINHENICINPLYGCGQTRCGCIGCPMAGKERWEQFSRYPKYMQAYINAFGKMLERRREKGLEIRNEWKNANSVFDWWMEDNNIDGQISFEFDGPEFIGYKQKGE